MSPEDRGRAEQIVVDTIYRGARGNVEAMAAEIVDALVRAGLMEGDTDLIPIRQNRDQ